ncbi:hypothetical protein BC936DRAFT_146647 [Jimgerdemannia flammicorona]|uniref:DHHA1 domain-containing protein n=1 Tax=Jimgerdemannia flammicorona TaxID=994334 RepID=A0A433D739_9FUNG|nr:hypothetical protein BC936DRAFT_146647 [Jimgerdemannia flammicorona]
MFAVPIPVCTARSKATNSLIAWLDSISPLSRAKQFSPASTQQPSTSSSTISIAVSSISHLARINFSRRCQPLPSFDLLTAITFLGNVSVDGFGARFAAELLLGKKATYLPAVYNDTPPPDNVLKGKRIGMFDFSFDRKLIEQWRGVAELVVVVDHHKTAQDNLQELDQVHFDLTKSGARLAWEFFHPDKPLPKFMAYIEDRVCMSIIAVRPRKFRRVHGHNVHLKLLVDEAITNGTQLLAVLNDKVMQICSNATTRTLRDTHHKVLVVNSPVFPSEVGQELASRDCDFGLVWFYDANRKSCRVSARSHDEKADVSEIVKRFGGGGHRNAAGFTWNQKNVDDLFD